MSISSGAAGGGALVLLVALCGACAGPEVKPTPAPPPPAPEPVSRHRAVNPLVDATESEAGGGPAGTIKTWGVMGTIDRRVTEKGLGRRFSAVVSCFERQVKTEPYLGGQMTLTFRLDARGKVRQVFLAQSDLGSLAVERCVMGELAQTAFPPPRGGETEFSFPLTFSGQLEPQWWSPARVRRLFRGLERHLQRLEHPPGLSLTFYVDRRGRVVSVGMCAEGPIEAAAADDLARRVLRMKFARHRARYVKVSYPVG